MFISRLFKAFLGLAIYSLFFWVDYKFNEALLAYKLGWERIFLLSWPFIGLYVALLDLITDFDKNFKHFESDIKLGEAEWWWDNTSWLNTDNSPAKRGAEMALQALKDTKVSKHDFILRHLISSLLLGWISVCRYLKGF